MKKEGILRETINSEKHKLADHLFHSTLDAMQAYADQQTSALREENAVIRAEYDKWENVHIKELDEKNKEIESLSARVSELQGEVGMWEGKWDDLKKLYDEETERLKNKIKSLLTPPQGDK